MPSPAPPPAATSREEGENLPSQQRRSRPLPLTLRIRRASRDFFGVPREALYSLRWDLLSGACSGIFTGLAAPFFTRIARGELHATETAIAILAASPYLGNMCSPIWARQMEGRAKMPFCIVAWLIARSLFFLIPFAFTPWAFVALMGSSQFISTVDAPAYTSLMKDIYPARARGRLMGYSRVIAQCLMFFSTLTAGRLLDHHISFRNLFPVAGAFGLAAAYAFSRVRPLPKTQLDSSADTTMTMRQFALDTLRILRQNEAYRWFAFSVFTYGFGNLMVQPLYGLFQVDVLHITNTQVANLANFGSLCSIAGFFLWGRIMDRIGAPYTVLLSICGVSSIALVYWGAHTVNGLLFASGLSGFSFAGIELSYLASILNYAEEGRAAQYQSLHSLLLGVRGILAPLIGIPIMKNLGYPTAFLLAFALMAIGGGMQYLATGKARQVPS